jgi:hypothetical protein
MASVNAPSRGGKLYLVTMARICDSDQSPLELVNPYALAGQELSYIEAPAGPKACCRSVRSGSGFVLMHLLHIRYEILLFLALTRHAAWKLRRQDRHSVVLEAETFLPHSGQVTSLLLRLAVFVPPFPSLCRDIISMMSKSNKSSLCGSLVGKGHSADHGEQHLLFNRGILSKLGLR